MAKSAATILKAALKQSLLPILAAEGFEKSPRCQPGGFFQYHRESDDGYHLVSFQKDKWWTAASGKFAINLGVYFPKLEEIKCDPATNDRPVVTGIPTAGDWSFLVRLSSLATGRDEWFEIRNLPPPPRAVANTDVEELARRLSDLWQAYGERWFAQHGKIENWAKSKKHASPALLLLMGEKTKARRKVIEGFLNRGGDPKSRLSWARCRGLLDDSEAARIAEAWHWPTAAFEEAIKEILLKDMES